MTTDTARAEGAELRQIIEVLERVDADKAELAEHRKEVLADAVGRGYDKKVLAKVLARRKMDRDTLAEEDAVLTMYEDALA